VARANRLWQAEAIGRMVTEGGIGQFLDLGAGLPTAPNTHEIAIAADPSAVVVYVDNDLTAISHGRALLADDRNSFFAGADLTDPDAVFADPDVAAALDLSKPLGIMLGLVLYMIPDPAKIKRFITAYLNAVPSGSYLALTHPLNPRDGSRYADFATAVEEKVGEAFPNVRFRTRDEVAGFFTGLDLVDPGLVDLATWRPDDPRLSSSGAAHLLAVGLARKP
jgi:hypothetical protein